MSEENNIVKIYNQADLIRDENNTKNPNVNENKSNVLSENKKKSISENLNNHCFISKIFKKTEYIILFIILISIIITSTFLWILLKKNKNGKSENDKTIKNEENIIKGNNGEIFVAKLKYEINQCRIYNETIKIKTKIILEEPLENGETEEIIEKDTTINKYLVNIYHQKEMEDKSILYYAYVLVLKVYNILNKDVNTIDYLGNNIFNISEYEKVKNYKNELIEEYINNLKEEENYEEMYEEIKEEIEYLNKSPLVKFSFFENGTIKQILKPNIIEPYIYSNIEISYGKVFLQFQKVYIQKKMIQKEI